MGGDFYVNRTGRWSGVDECQVTLVEGEILDLLLTFSLPHRSGRLGQLDGDIRIALAIVT